MEPTAGILLLFFIDHVPYVCVALYSRIISLDSS